MGNTVIEHLKDLDGQLIELHVPVLRGRSDNDYLGMAINTVARVKVISGDRDVPPHIQLGQSVLPLDAKVKRQELCGLYFYELKE